MSSASNLDFRPKPIDAVAIRAGEGPNLHVAIGMVQRIAALRAYESFGSGRDWIDQVSSAYVVALATRSADTLLIKFIQDDLNGQLSLNCSKCRDASIGLSQIPERLFPILKTLREHANALIHHLDNPESKGVAELNIEGVFCYCHHLFHENIDALFGIVPNPHGKFTHVKCKACRSQPS